MIHMTDINISMLESIYRQIHACRKCHETSEANIKPDCEKVQKKVFEQYLNSNLFIIGQSLASNQVRLSGIPFHNPQGIMSPGGKFLERYLNKIGYTISPSNPNYQLVYVSDIIQCYPGKKPARRGDNTPTKQAIENCKEWLLKEMELINFRVLLLLGSVSAKSFFEYILNKQIKKPSEYYCRDIYIRIAKSKYHAFVLPHPVSMVSEKSKIYETTFGLVKDKLE
jgi:uracil-DNA glycosylase family 4